MRGIFKVTQLLYGKIMQTYSLLKTVLIYFLFYFYFFYSF